MQVGVLRLPFKALPSHSTSRVFSSPTQTEFIQLNLSRAHSFQARTSRTAFRVCDNIAAVHLHKRRLYKKARFSAPASSNYKDIFIPRVFRLLRRLFMVSRSVCVKGILFSNTGSVYGFMSSAPPQRAEPYSVPRRYFFAFLPLV